MHATCSLQCAALASRAARTAPVVRRSFFSSAPGAAVNRRPLARMLPQPADGERRILTRGAKRKAKKYPDLRPYTAAEREALEQKYTPEQIAAIEAGEEAVDAADILAQGSLRNDPMALGYFDDFATTDQHVDYKRTNLDRPVDPRSLNRTAKNPMDEGIEDEYAVYDAASLRQMVSTEDSVVENALPKFSDPLMRRTARESRSDSNSDQLQFLAQLSKQTGMDVAKLRRLRVKKLVQHRVSNQTRMGKISKQYVLMIAGDRRGLLGIGEGSAVEMEQAVAKARRNAIRSMVPIPRYEERTIFGDVKGKVGATELELYTRPPGFGLRCQEKILEMCKCAGISDLSARVTRARNPMNTVKAAFHALLNQRDPEQIARARGRKLVDVRRVYYAGNV